MIAQTEVPGLADNERGYSTGAEDWPLARVRLTPVQDDPAIAAQVNGPVVPRQIVVQISVSLIDDDGQVRGIGGRLLVQEASRFSWALGGPAALDVESWLHGVIETEIGRLISAARDLQAASAAGLLVPPDITPAPTATPLTVSTAAAAAMAATMKGGGDATG